MFGIEALLRILGGIGDEGMLKGMMRVHALMF